MHIAFKPGSGKPMKRVAAMLLSLLCDAVAACRRVQGLALVTMVAVLASACGGGGGGGGGGGSVGTAPSITTQPAAQSVSNGATASFVVAASGDAPLSYRWQRNGVDIPGAVAPALTVVATAADNGAGFRAVVSNASGSATSAAALLTVTSSGVGTLNGISVSAANASTMLAVTATVPGRPAANSTTIQSFNIQGVPASERIVLRTAAPGHLDQLKIAAVRAGAVSLVRSTLLPVGATATLDPAAGGTVVVSGSAAQVIFPANAFERVDNAAAPTGSVSVTATVLAGARDPDRIPGDNTTLDGAALAYLDSLGGLAVTAVDASGQGLRLAAGKQAAVRVPVSSRDTDTTPSAASVYRLSESDGLWASLGTASLAGTGNARYFEGTLSGLGYLNVARTAEFIQVKGCTQAGANRTRNRSVRAEGIDYTFAGYAFTGLDGSFSVAVRKNSRAVLFTTGGTESTAPMVVGPSATDITLPACLVERGNITTAPSFIAQPQSSTVQPGAAVRLHVVVDGKLPIGLQWQRNGITIAGETGTSLTFTANAADNGAVYTVVATNGTGSTTSSAAVLTVAGATGSGQGCFDGLPAAGTRFQATYDLKNAGASYGTKTFDVLMGGTGTFEGGTARFSTVGTRTTTVSGGTTTTVVTSVTPYVNATAAGELTEYGQLGTFTITASSGSNSSGDSKLVQTPAFVNRVPGLTVGGSLAQSFTVLATGSTNGIANPPITSTTTQTTTFVAIETLVLPAGSFQACKYVSDTSGTLITYWNLVGTGWMLKLTTGALTEEATAVQVTTP